MGPPRKENACRRDPACKRASLKRWREANPEKVKRQRQRHWKTRAEQYRDDPSYYLWRTAKARAGKTGVTFTIEPSDVVVPKHCPILGLPISILAAADQNGASLDRVDNSKGYVKGNVRVISRKANRMKGDLTIETLDLLREYMEGAR